MLPPSDNFFAETLVKDLGARLGGAGTTAAGAAVVSSDDRVAARHPSARRRRLRALAKPTAPPPTRWPTCSWSCTGTPVGAVLREHMAVAGRTGTLELRMRHTGAAGRCQGKTGTLTGVSNLVGYCQSGDGHLLAFAFFTDGIAVEAAHTFQDHMAITLASSAP